ncbi:Hsp70 family protein [Nocardia sp. CDC160]|uniref:Hsp70 family protein n=1 Tax=Nocardia sp. CDC160 TaxID=3112166 RepID=UPI002DBF3577|nr:Hsp70 family protein [Nocardia sp. CDC160]MEC3920522.1 Hsp70 family protein [Nocardia sp. CDC160]
MSQGLALGITVGSSNTVAVTTSGGQHRVHTGPSMLGAEREVPESFLSRVGDPVDIRTRDGSAVRAADLVAAAIGRTLDEAGPADAVIACYPAWWSQHTVEVQRAALAEGGLDAVTLVPEPTAAMRWLQEVHESSHDGAMAVYDLGATGLTVSVARTGAMSGLLGEPVRTTAVAGSEFDLLTMRYVLAHAIGDKDFDPFDPLVEQELAALRVRCKIAKESLSTNTATVVPVRLPGMGQLDVRLVRDDIEELLRGPLLGSTDLVREALRRAGVAVADLDGFLLTGGGASIPLVTELLSTEFGVPVAAAADPAHLSAHGAALLAADLLADTTDTEAHPAIAGRSGYAEADAAPALPRTAAGLPQRVRPDSLTGSGESTRGDTGHAPEYAASQRVPLLPELPTPEPSGGFRQWKRLAVFGAAALAVAAVATGTLAMGTGAQSSSTNPSAPQAPSTSAVALDTPAPTGGATVSAAPIAGSPVVATKSAQQPGGAKSAPTGGPAPGDSAAQADTPAPQQNSGGPQAPAQQPPTQAQQPPQTQPQAPTQVPTIPSPSLPTGALNNAVDPLGNAIPQAPVQVVPHIGG